MKELDPIYHSIFSDSEALADLDNLKTTQASEYYAMGRQCEYCGANKECQVSWLEMYCLANGILPQDLARFVGQPGYFESDWTFDGRHRVFHPNARCHCQGSPVVMFGLVPAEAQRLYEASLKNKVISPEQRGLIIQMAPAIQQMQMRASGRRPAPAQQQQMQQQQMQQMPQQQMQGYPPGYRGR